MTNTTNVLIVGVGGQGTILASRVLSGVLLSGGFDVKVSEIHGMSQRGGSVVTQVRYGEEVHSPIIRPGEADIILAFEQLEALRYLPYLREGGKIITNLQKLLPMPVVTGKAKYPEDVMEILGAACDVIAVDAHDLAVSCGNPKGVNVVLLGVLSKYMEFPENIWQEVLRARVPSKIVEANLLCFAAGRAL